MMPDKCKLQQIAITAAGMIGVGGVMVYRTLNPAPNDYQAIADLYLNPTASFLGALFPVIILAPFGYWITGRLIRRHLIHSRSNSLVWQTFLENDPEITAVVERMSSLSPKNVEKFRVLLVQHRDCTRAKEFEDEAIRRIQGPAFVGDASLREAYISLNQEDARLGDELVRVVRVIGTPKDLERTIAQVRKKVPAKGKFDEADQDAPANDMAPTQFGHDEAQEPTGAETVLEQKPELTDPAFVADPAIVQPPDVESSLEQQFEPTDPVIVAEPPIVQPPDVETSLEQQSDLQRRSAPTDPMIVAEPASVQPRQPRSAALVTGLLGLVVVASVGVWLANTHRTPLPPSTPVTAGTFEEALAAFNRSDYGTALRLFRPLADQGDVHAQYDLGLMYLDGQGIPQNDAEAVRWFRLAADRGHAAAQNNLGASYLNGRGVPQNYGEATKWYRKAADQGHVLAQFSLGTMYAEGNGVPQSFAEAMKWFRLAADQGNADAQFGLGGGYYHGLGGMPKNYAEALKWFRLAADQGDIGAQSYLGVMYANGEATPQNYVNAYMWFSLAAAQGDKDAVKKYELALQHLTVAEVAEAQRRVREWKPKSTSH